MAGKINGWSWRFPNRARWRVQLTRPDHEPIIARCAWKKDLTEGTPPLLLVHFDTADKQFARHEEDDLREFLAREESTVVLALKKTVAGKVRVGEVTNLYIVRPLGSFRGDDGWSSVRCEVVGGRP